MLDAPKVARLHKLDCFLVSGNVTVNKNTVEEFALIYKGEAIAKGTKADFQNQIKEIGKNIHNEKQLLQTPEGKQFLEAYNNVMLTLGGIAAPFAILGLAKMGLKLLKNAEQVAGKVIRSCMLKVLLEKNIIIFEKQATFLLVDEIGLSSGNELVFQRLQDQGVVYLKGIRQGDKTEKLFAIYDDVVLAEINNTPEGITKFAGQYRGIKGDELSLELEQYVKRGVKQIGAIEYEMLSSNLLKKYTTDMIALSKRKGVNLEIKWIDNTHPDFYSTKMGSLEVTLDRNKLFLNLRKECPKITLYHERWHLEDFLEMGWKRYTDISKNTPWIHEQKVWERIYKNRNKWSEPELVDAYLYYQGYIATKSNYKFSYMLKEMEVLGKKINLIK